MFTFNNNMIYFFYREERSDCMETYQNLWIQTKGQLEALLAPDTYNEVFIGVNTVVKYTNGTIYVLCPSSLIKTKINKLYAERIQNILASLTKETLRFKFVTSEEVVSETSQKIESAPEKVSLFNSKLNPSYTFETFVVGESNRFAFRMATQVSDPDQGVFVANPLYIFGGVGLGKTHLMQAIGNAIIDSNVNKRVLYISATDFVDDYAKAGQKNDFEAFHEKYDNLDTLLVDDIQMLKYGRKSQQEFFKLFNNMHDSNRLIVITSDRPADQLKDIMDRLTTRFNWGLAVDIKVPSLEHRVKILKRKLNDSSSQVVSDEVLTYIASNFSNNIRELESTLQRVLNYSIEYDKDVDIELAKEAILPLIASRKNSGDNKSYENCMSIVADFYNITVSDLIGKNRSSKYITPRHICMYILKTKYDLPYKKIGSIMGGKDHTTVIAAVTKINHEKEIDNAIGIALEKIMGKIE